MDVGVFMSLALEPKAVPKVVQAIEGAVASSFNKRHGMIIVPGRTTDSEMKRRVNICLDIFKVLRGDMKWSWQRACDHLPQYLDKVLNGEDWEPCARTAWAPQE